MGGDELCLTSSPVDEKEEEGWPRWCCRLLRGASLPSVPAKGETVPQSGSGGSLGTIPQPRSCRHIFLFLAGGSGNTCQ